MTPTPDELRKLLDWTKDILDGTDGEPRMIHTLDARVICRVLHGFAEALPSLLDELDTLRRRNTSLMARRESPAACGERDAKCEHFAEAASLAAIVQEQARELEELRSHAGPAANADQSAPLSDVIHDTTTEERR